MGLLSGLFQTLGLAADPNAGKSQMKASQAQIDKAVKLLEDVGIPSIEAQKLVLETPELVGELVPESLSASEFDKVQESPELRQNQMKAIRQLDELSKGGLTDEELLAYRDLQDQSQADAMARQNTIMRQLEQEGNLDSGARLISQLASSQASTGEQAAGGRDLMRQGLASRRDAISRLAQTSGQLSDQDFGRQMGLAKEKSAIEAQNAAYRSQANQYNLGNRQSIENQRAATKNLQEQANKGLLQQNFQNQLARTQGISNAYMGQSSNLMNQAQAAAQAEANQAAGNRSLLVGGLGAAAQAGWISDVRAKMNIKDGSDDIKEMLKNVDSYEYDYKPEIGIEGKQAGVMAQDLEQTDLGQEYVEENEDGLKMVNYGKMVPALLAGLSDQVKETEDLKAQVANLKKIFKL